MPTRLFFYSRADFLVVSLWQGREDLYLLLNFNLHDFYKIHRVCARASSAYIKLTNVVALSR